MQNNAPNNQTQPYTFTQLHNLISLLEMLTGDKPTAIGVKDSYYTWYVQQSQKEADMLGLELGFRTDPIQFMGVQLFNKEAKDAGARMAKDLSKVANEAIAPVPTIHKPTPPTVAEIIAK